MENEVLEEIQGADRKILIKIADQTIQEKYLQALKKIAPKVKIDGFRKGKIPQNILVQHYGNSALQEAISELMQNSFYEFVAQNNIDLAGSPQFNMVERYIKGNDFSFEAVFEVFPIITEIKGISDIEIEKPEVEITEQDIDKLQDVLLKQKGTWVNSTEKTEKNMRVTIDFVGSVDGIEFAGGKAKDFVLILGQGQMIPGFEEELLNKTVGENFDINVSFPEDYHVEDLKGKPAKFTINLTKVESIKLPKLTKALIQQFSPNSSNVEELRSEIKQNMQRELDNKLFFKLKTQVAEALVKANDIQVPKSLISREITNLKNQAIQQYGQGNKNMDLPDGLFAEQAKKMVQIGLLLNKFIQDEKLVVDEELVQQKIANIAASYEDRDEVVSYYNSNKELRNNINGLVLEELAIKKIESLSNNVMYKKLSFDEVVNS